MYERINITLPKETVELMDRVAKKGERSSLIDAAVKYFVESIGLKNLKKQLQDGAIQRASRDLRIATEWFDFDEDER